MTLPPEREIYCDEDVPDAVALSLRQRGHVVHQPREARMVGEADAAVLETCRHSNWLIVTQNRRDFQRLHALWTTLYA